MKELSKEQLVELIALIKEKTGGQAFCLIVSDRSLLAGDVPLGVPFYSDTRIVFAGVDQKLQIPYLQLAAETQKQVIDKSINQPPPPPQPDGSTLSPYFNNLGPI